MARKKRTPEENARREKIRELLRRLTPPPLTSPRSAVIFVEKAAAACAAPALKYFCSILHHNLAFTQNLGLTPSIGYLLPEHTSAM